MMSIFLSPYHYRLHFAITLMILLGVVVTAIAQEDLPDLFSSPRISKDEKAQFRALEQQLRQLEQAFVDEGGFTEKLYHARQKARRG